MNKTAWEPAPPPKAGICGSCIHLNKNILSRRSYPAKYPCLKSARAHTEFDKCDVFPDQEEKPAGEFNAKALGSNISYWLKKRGMSQRDLAEKVGSTAASISRYVAGDRVPSGPKLYQIAKVLGCTAEEIMRGVMASGNKAEKGSTDKADGTE